MGLTYTFLEISPSFKGKMHERIKFLVDSGAEYSVVPKEQLTRLGIEPHRDIEVLLADGSVHHRQAGDAFFEFQGECAASPVVFGEKGDEALLGAVTLETLGFLLDPLRRRIIKRKAIRL